MTFSYEKKNLLTPAKEKRLSTFLLALLIATAFFIPFILDSEGYFIFFGDFNVQQIPFYQLCHEAVKSGNWGWNWNTDLGSNLIASYSFYTLGSPFFWLTIPFPTDFLPYLMGPLLILKFACAALTGYLYIRRFTRTPFAAQIGGLLYAFSGFSIYNIFFNHFHEAIIVLPLLLLSLELLITENRRGVFALCVALCAITNYFFFFGMVVFTIIYWFIRVISGAIKFKFTRFLLIILESVLGLAIAAVLLVPSIKMILANTRVSDFLMGWPGILYGKEQIYLNIIECFFFPPDIPARPVFFPGANVKWSSLGGWLPLFSMTAVLGFCSSKRGHWLKRIICTSFFMALVPILNSAFYAFNSSYYARWFYMPILMMALATAITLEEKEINWKLGFNWTAVITVAIALVVGLFPQKIKDDNNPVSQIVFGLYTDAGKKDNIYLERFLIAVGIAVASLLLCRLIIYLRGKGKTLFQLATIGILSITIAIYSSVYLYQGSYHSYDKKAVMIDKLIEEQVTLPEEGNYRIDTYDCVDNTAMFLGYPSINAFHSVVSPSIMEFYDYIGVTRDVASRAETDIYSIRNFLSVKYLLNRSDSESFLDENGYTLMPGYKYITTSGGYYIYENASYIPYGFSYDYYITEDECKDKYSTFDRANMMLKAMVLSKEDAAKYSHLLKNFTDSVPNEITDTENESTDYSPSASFSEETLAQDSDFLAQSSAFSFETDKGGFSASVSREEGTLVFFSVPFDEGWTATVNGEKAEIIKANVGFMAVEVPAGVSDIRFDYETPGLKMGIIISLSSLTLLIIYLVISFLFKRTRPVNEVYPEGEQLLSKWYDQDYREEFKEIEETQKDLLDTLPESSELFIDESNNKYQSGFHIDLSAFEEKDKESIDNNSDE